MQTVSQLDGLGQLITDPEAFSAVAAHLLPTGSGGLQAWLAKTHKGLDALESSLSNPAVGKARLLELRGEHYADPVRSAEADSLEQLLADPQKGLRKLHSVRRLLLCLNDGEQ